MLTKTSHGASSRTGTISAMPGASCCDGCSLGTSGLHDWTMKGVHLCNVRLELPRLNTMPSLDYHLLEDVRPLHGKSEKELRQMGRLSVPMIRCKGDCGFRRISWNEITSLLAEELRRIDPKRIGWYMTSRGLTNEAYYAHQKVARFLGTNRVDTSARICHAPITSRSRPSTCTMPRRPGPRSSSSTLFRTGTGALLGALGR
jgi:anaerobic selenocysteine-containing dehydrogenase